MVVDVLVADMQLVLSNNIYEISHYALSNVWQPKRKVVVGGDQTTAERKVNS